MNLSRRGFFKGVAALVAGVTAAQLPGCTTGAAPAVAAQPKKPTLADLKKISAELRTNAGTFASVRINRYKGDILAHAVPTELYGNAAIQRTYVVRRFLPYSPDPLVEGVTPTPTALHEPDPLID